MDIDGKHCFGGRFGSGIVVRKNYLITGGQTLTRPLPQTN